MLEGTRGSAVEPMAPSAIESPPIEGGWEKPGDVSSRVTSCAIVASTADASTNSCFWKSAREIAADMSRAVWNLSSGFFASPRMTSVSSSDGTSRANVEGGSTTPERTASSKLSPVRLPWSGRLVRSSCRMTPSA